MRESRAVDDARLDRLTRQGRELRQQTRFASSRHTLPPSGRACIGPLLRASVHERQSQHTPLRQAKSTQAQKPQDVSVMEQGIHNKTLEGRMYRGLLQSITSTPRPHGAIDARTGTPSRPRQTDSDFLLQTPQDKVRGTPLTPTEEPSGLCMACVKDKITDVSTLPKVSSEGQVCANCGKAAKGLYAWQEHPIVHVPASSGGADFDSCQVSSRSSDVSTVTPGPSARSLRQTPAASPQSSARSLRTSSACSPPVSGRPPRMAPPTPLRGRNTKIKVDASRTAVSAKIGDKSSARGSLYVPPVQSNVLYLPERLAEAARSGDVRQTSEILAQLPEGAPSCVQNKDGWTALHYAASEGHLEVCQLLLNARGDANVELPDFSTPLMLAVEEGKLPVAELLLKNGARWRCKDEAGFTAMDRCAPDMRPEFESSVQQLA